MSLLHDIETVWVDSASTAIVRHAGEHPDERWYAAALWLCYTDYTLFGSPCFAMNTESRAAQMEPELRWSPADWQLPCIDSTVATMQPYYSTLTESLKGVERPFWDQTIEEHYACLARVCRAITHRARSRLGVFSDARLPDDFVMGLFEIREPDPLFTQLVRASIDPEILSGLPDPIWEPL
ncbi:DUF4303 domain-containing protein [Prosthecobacter vanneervenii]|uniref:Uncharacterized protein n=1 Tax=Prosthecobacter vanneervenii TaxID=48466 RepID=A0A7W7Y849_9BACT|nr:DUF4303 domain-containing protein [Prosthecobacter vanneervenii]MBB5031388.1 hypothetical protein [Prosthecobacter vanneervenii]